MKAKKKQKIVAQNTTKFKDVLNNLLQGPVRDETFTIEMLKSIIRDQKNDINIYPKCWDIQNNKREKKINDFFAENEKFISVLLLSSVTLKESMKKLISPYGDNPEFFFKIVNTNITQIYNVLKYFLLNELNSLLTFNELLQSTRNKKHSIRGFLLNYYCDAEIFSINQNSLESLINILFLNSYVNLFLLDENNREWFNAYMEKHRSPLKVKLEGGWSSTNKKNVGPLPKFKTEKELHAAIKKIKNYESLSISQLSIKLELSKNRLGQLLKEKSWNLPKE